ncbi:MAG: hypothetical protein AMXMBFR57_36090 [Acidimicrobiia bacterium]
MVFDPTRHFREVLPLFGEDTEDMVVLQGDAPGNHPGLCVRRKGLGEMVVPPQVVQRIHVGMVPRSTAGGKFPSKAQFWTAGCRRCGIGLSRKRTGPERVTDHTDNAKVPIFSHLRTEHDLASFLA